MVNIYSIKEILEASDSILKSSKHSKSGTPEKSPPIGKKVLENKKDFNVLMDKHLPLKSADSKNDIPEVLEKIILDAESSQLNIYKTIKGTTDHKSKKILLEQNTINQKNLIDDLYKTFGKKIKRNSLKLILELRNDIIHLTKNISSLKQNKIKLEQNNIKLNKNIDSLKDEEGNLQNNLGRSINGFNKLNYEHKNLKLTLNELEENLLNNNEKLNGTVETNNQLNHNLKRSKESFNTLYDNHKDLKLNFSTVEEDLNYKKKKLSISGELNEKLERKIKNIENK